ncbi:MAG: acyl-CoA dehydrogenase family protein [Caldilineaceae bacterium]|nr:acyl-CoA dehydrogenase family protein [Caldilineaceae bacterium]
MDLAYGAEYDAFRGEVRQFLETHGHRAPKGTNPPSPAVVEWQKLLISNGYAARTIPREYGGYGAETDILKSRIIAEEFAAARVSPGIGGIGVSMLVPTVLELGTEEQKRRHVRPTIEGETIWCQGYSEPGSGSDLASLRTRAHLDGDHWVINGQKIWTSGAHVAHWMFCLVRTEPDAPKHQGISFLLLRMDTPGIETRPLVDMTGAANFNEVFFTDVRVPRHQMIGERGEGWRVANTILGHERNFLGDPDESLARVYALIRLMQSETVDGRPLMEHPTYRDRLMRIQGRVMAMRFNDLRILSAKVNGRDATLAGMIVKLQGTELRHELEQLGIDVMGERGLAYGEKTGPDASERFSWQTHYMFYLGLIIGGGTSQIQKNIIGERGLGLPREPKALPGSAPWAAKAAGA